MDEALIQAVEHALQNGDLCQAELLCRQTLDTSPHDADAFGLLGKLAYQIGDTEAAVLCFRQALVIDGNRHQLYNYLGTALKELGQWNAAVAAFRQALTLRPDDNDAAYNLGTAWLEQGHYEAAAACFETVLTRHSNHADTLNNFGVALHGLGRLAAAEAAYHHALATQPTHADALNNLGAIYQETCRPDDALQCHRAALKHRPDFAAAHMNYARLLLLQGLYGPGWREYAWRTHPAQLEPVFVYPYPFPLWAGEPLAGKTLLIHAEQGLGDEIMYASILPEIITEAGHCIIECNKRLGMLFQRSFPAATVVGINRDQPEWATQVAQWINHAPPIDYQIPIGGLPRWRRVTAADFSHHAGYLQANLQRAAYWRQRLMTLGRGRKIGISWRGGTAKTGGARRSIDLDQLHPLLETPDTQFISLQYDSTPAELADFQQRTGVTLHHWQEAIDNYDETAALTASLDQVISVCTAAVHLAGALGKPTWIFTPAMPEWPYGLSGETSLWYPSVRLFRQASGEDWATVIARVARALPAAVNHHHD